MRRRLALPALIVAAVGVARAEGGPETIATSIPAPSADPAWPIQLPFSLGYVFTVSSPITVTALGRFDIDGGGLTSDALSRLYSWETGAELASATISSASPAEPAGSYNAHFAATEPIVLLPGTRYLIAVEVDAGDFGFDQTAPYAVHAPEIRHLEGRATAVGWPGMPAIATSETFGIASPHDTYYGPNFKYVPELPADSLALLGPTGRAVFQRGDSDATSLVIDGFYSGGVARIEARAVPREGFSGTPTGWQVIDAAPVAGAFSGSLSVARGWYDIEVRSLLGATVVAVATVERVGVGEVFITAGQSNSANHGSPAQVPDDDRVSARTAVAGDAWRLARDPQPVASGVGGSPWPELGDLLARELDAPVGFLSVGVGSTRVIDWLPGKSFYDDRLRPAMESLGVGGFRAVLWHQGESDTIAGVSSEDYASALNLIVGRSREDAGFDAPWGVALASFHPVPGDGPEVIAGQRRVIDADPLVFAGAATDDLLGAGWRSDGVHFNQAGLEEHAVRWFRAILSACIIEGRGGDGLPSACRTFRRGDSNDDGRVDISDAVVTLVYLVGSGSPIRCLDALDANDDGGVDLSDPVALLDALFRPDVPPGVPPLRCGADPTGDTLGCEAFASCDAR